MTYTAPIERLAKLIATRHERPRRCRACHREVLRPDRFCSDQCYNDWTADSTP